jgi:hypothetical protein
MRNDGSHASLAITLTQRLLLLLMLLLSVYTGARSPYQIGLWGDLPYNDIQATIGVPNLIKVR